MTNQEVFDKVAKHLLTQGGRCGITDGEGEFHCKYRGPKGTKCAVGCLIDDAYYDEDIEGVGIKTHDNVYQAVCDSVGFEPDRDMLVDLQDLHDRGNPSKWAERLRHIAHDYGLEFHGL